MTLPTILTVISTIIFLVWERVAPGRPLPGVSGWYPRNFFAATGKYFYHANIRTPTWLRYFVQTPELHSIHHQYDVHRFNFSDIPLWDRLFGTYRDTIEFMPRCGFPDGAEQGLPEMLRFKDVYESDHS